MKSILGDRDKLNQLRDIIFADKDDLDLLEAETHALIDQAEEEDNEEPKDDPYEVLGTYLGEYLSDYDAIGIINDIATNDADGNLILRNECRNENGWLTDFFANAVDCHHITTESYWMTTSNGDTLYVGDSQDDCVDCFISYMDEVHDTEAGVVDFDEMIDILDGFGAPVWLEITQELACAPTVYHYHGRKF